LEADHWHASGLDYFHDDIPSLLNKTGHRDYMRYVDSLDGN